MMAQCTRPWLCNVFICFMLNKLTEKIHLKVFLFVKNLHICYYNIPLGTIDGILIYVYPSDCNFGKLRS